MNRLPQNFAIRIIVCIAITFVTILVASYVGRTFLWHQPFKFEILNNVVLPVAIGIFWAYTYKPKE